MGDVYKRQPLNVSILVDDQADFLFVALKLHQLRAEGRTFRDKIDPVSYTHLNRGRGYFVYAG